MGVQLVGETVEQEQPNGWTPEDLRDAYARLEALAGAPIPASEPAAPRVIVKRALPDREILSAMAGLGSVLAVRLMLLLAVVGAFLLAYLAMTGTNTMGLYVLVAYALTIVAPLVWLSTKRT